VPPSARLLAVTLLASACALSLGSPSHAQQSCPTTTFLAFDHLVYAAEQVPASVSLTPGRALGDGRVDEPTDATGCRRRQDDVGVVRAGEIDPGVAVAVAGRPGVVFVLGGRCAGYANDDRWRCLLEPLSYAGASYTGTSYPVSPGTQGTVTLGAPLGGARLGGEAVTAVRIDGVDPAVAVGVEGRPHEAFLASGVCPYERFANRLAADDLSRCLRSPVWLFFDPPGGRVGEQVTARADRPLAGVLAGATVSLARLSIAADIVPRDVSGSVPIATLAPGGRTLPFTIPDVGQGLYEAVVTCGRCAAAHGGRTRFPAGSILVVERKSGGTSARPVVLAVGAILLLLIPAALLAWRRGWHRRGARPGG
jgi:hypothetical protein